MHKIANTAELTVELERLLDYAGSNQPSREVLARDLSLLSQRLAGDDDSKEHIIKAAKDWLEDVQSKCVSAGIEVHNKGKPGATMNGLVKQLTRMQSQAWWKHWYGRT